MTYFKVWAHIEEFDEDDEPLDDEPAEPEMIGEFETLEEAQEYVSSIAEEGDYGNDDR